MNLADEAIDSAPGDPVIVRRIAVALAAISAGDTD
jgi:hypothetical protein